MNDDPDIYAIRQRARCTQDQFADALGIPANTVRSWEQRRKRPSGAARTLLRLIVIGSVADCRNVMRPSDNYAVVFI